MGSPRVPSFPNTVLTGLNDSQAHREVLTLRGSPGARTCQKGPREAKGSIQLGVIQYLEKVCFQTLWHQHGAGRSWGLFPCSPHCTSHQEGLGWRWSKTSEKWAFGRKFFRDKIRDFLGGFHLIVYGRLPLWGKWEEVGQLRPSREMPRG